MNSFSPVTGDEMQTFFGRLSTMVVQASDQGRQLEYIKEQVNRLQDQISHLVQENSHLKTQVAETWQTVSNLEKERESLKAELQAANEATERARQETEQVRQDYEARLSQAHDALLMRDSRIADLEQTVIIHQRESSDWQEKYNISETTSQGHVTSRDWWRDKADNLDKEVARLVTALSDTEYKLSRTEAKLATVQAKLQEIRSTLEPETSEVVSFPGSTAQVG